MDAEHAPAPDPGRDAVSREELRDSTFQGVRWFTIARACAEVASISAAVALAHLIAPSEFGRLAVTVIVSELSLAIANETIGTPLVQRRSITPAHRAAGALLGPALGALLMLLTLVAVPLVTTPLFGAPTTELFRLFAPAFVLAGLMIVPLATLQRQLRFRRIAAIEVASTMVGAATSVSLAVADLGAKAYVLGTLTGLAVSTAALLASAAPPLPRWHARETRELLGFGVPAALAALAGVGYRNVDYTILGARLAPLTVGLYYRAFTCAVEYERKISGVIARVALPVYSRTQDLGHMRAIRARIVRVDATLMFPVLGMLIATAPVLIPWLFGARWEPAVVPAQILAIAGMAATVKGNVNPLVLAAGRPRALLAFTICELVLYAATVLAASSHGLIVVAIAVSAFQVIALLLAYRLMLQPLVGVSPRQLTGDVGPAAAATAALLAVALPLSQALRDALPAPVQVAAVAAAGCLVYAIVLRALFPAAWADIRLLAGRVLIPRRRGADKLAGPISPARAAVRAPAP